MALTYDLISKIIMSEAYHLYYLRWDSQIWCVDFPLDGGVLHTILVHFDIDF